MRFDHLHRLVTYLVATLGLLALNLGSELSGPARGIIALGLVGSWFTPRAWLRNPSYSKVVTGILVALFALQVVRAIGAESPLGYVVEFAGFLQLSRLFHRRSARDHQHIQGLAFVHLIAATLLSSTISYGLIFVGFVLTMPWMLALTHLRTEIELSFRAPGEALEGIPPDEVDVALRARNLAGFRFLALTAGLAVPAFLVTASFFLLFPRVGMGFLNFGGAGGRQVAGFSTNVELGGFGTIRSDPTTVARLYPDDLPAQPPAARRFRLRGTSFDHFDGEAWEYTGPLARELNANAGMEYYHLHRASLDPRRSAELRVDLDPLGEPVIFLPPDASVVRIAPRVSGGRPSARRILLREDGELRYHDLDGIGLRYSVFIPDEGIVLDHEEGLTAEERLRYLQLPDDLDPRIAELASRRAGEGVDSTRASRLDRWLGGSGDFRYTLEQPNGEADDHLATFLLETRAGHCEYFATALAVMLRTQGIPSRNVTGYAGGAFNPFGGYYAIRQGDAHSWVEAYVDGHWVTFDPTPASAAELAPANQGFMHLVRSFFDSLRARWDRDVVAYDMNTQVSVLRQLYRQLRERGWFGRSGRHDAGGDQGSDEEELRGAASGEGLGSFAAAALLVLLAIGVLVVGLRRRRSPGPVLPADAEEARRAWIKIDRAAQSVGLGRESGRTVREQCEGFVEAGVDSALVWGAHEAYIAARFGARALGPDDHVLFGNLARDLARLSEQRRAAA